MKSNNETFVVPVELADVLIEDGEAGIFFEYLAESYKRRYCDWVNKAKQPETREARANWVRQCLAKKQKVLKIDSFMGDVGIIKKMDDMPELKTELNTLCEGKTHKDISRYSLLLAEHVLRLTETPLTPAIQECFTVNLKWQEGTASFQEARDVAGKMHQLARAEKDSVKIKVYRILGQVAATPHVKRHALIASDYAVTLINLMHPGGMEEVRKERNYQIELMKSV